MASKQTYPCYVCKRNGFENVRVYLDGKSGDGRTIYKNEDMSPHQHKQAPQQQYQHPQQQPQASIADVLLQVKLLHQKLDSLIDTINAKNK